MDVEVFEVLLTVNRSLDSVIESLKKLETNNDFDKGSVELFTIEAEQLKAGVNRYIGERMVHVADADSSRLDAIRDSHKKNGEEEEEP